MVINDFEKEWTELAVEICKSVYNNTEIQKVRSALEANGFLTMEQKSEFINVCDHTKYDLIYKKYGFEGSEGYAKFSAAWREWFQNKGVESSKNRGQRNSVEHILFGSTPDPVAFLKNFEQEVPIQ